MNEFQLYNETNAPDLSKESLIKVKKKYGFIPNVLALLAESPSTLNSYLHLAEKIDETSFTTQEQQVLFFIVSQENKCRYCMAVHSVLAKKSKLPDSILKQLKASHSLEDPKLNSLAHITRQMVSKRGWLSEEEMSDFLEAGYSKANLLEVIMVVALKTISNYSNHIAKTPLDGPFKSNS